MPAGATWPRSLCPQRAVGRPQGVSLTASVEESRQFTMNCSGCVWTAYFFPDTPLLPGDSLPRKHQGMPGVRAVTPTRPHVLSKQASNATLRGTHVRIGCAAFHLGHTNYTFLPCAPHPDRTPQLPTHQCGPRTRSSKGSSPNPVSEVFMAVP